MIEFLYWTYFAIATIIFFVEFTKDKNIFVVLLGFLFGGALILMIPVLPIFLIKLNSDDYFTIRELIAGAYLLTLIFLCFRYFIFGYLKTESKELEEVSNSVKKREIKDIKTKSNSTNHDRFKPKQTEYKNVKKINTNKIQTSVVEEPKTVFKPKEKNTNLKPTFKQKIKENLPKSVIEENSVLSEIKYVDYNLYISVCELFFPIVKIPNQKCVVRSHRFGSTKRRGFKENSFQKAIEYFFAENFEISGNTRLNTGKNTRPYEPDIALIGFSNKNIRIDIEIDEPYAGITRQPTHCIGDDINRDNYFRDRGWIVIRFSEYQVHKQEKKCLKFISNIINSIDNSIKIPTELEQYENLEKEKVWNIVQAQKWEKSKYREQYLNHEFKKTEELKETIKRDFNNQEIEEEKQVKQTSFGTEDIGKNFGFNKSNIHPRDSRIKFYSETHIYTIDGVPVPSVSTIIGRFFPEFDSKYWSNRKAPQLGMTAEKVAEMWAKKGKAARNKGTFLHEQIENYYLGIDYKRTDEFDQFENFRNDHINLKPYRSEWRIFDDNLNIAGTIDLIASNRKKFDIYDWKRSKKVVNTFNGLPIEINQWQQGVGNLSHIDDTSYNRYCLQQSLYKFILEQNYGIEINSMYLIVMYPENDNYYKLNVPYLKSEIEYILQAV